MKHSKSKIDIHPELIINYILDGKERKHYPDIFIPKENLIIEVKSKFTYFKYVAKNKQQIIRISLRILDYF
jgi:hypothetical protein